MFLCVIEHSRGVSRATPPDPAGRSIIACWLDEFFGRAGLEHASSGAEAKAIDERCPERMQMRKSLMTGAVGVNEQCMLTIDCFAVAQKRLLSDHLGSVGLSVPGFSLMPT